MLARWGLVLSREIRPSGILKILFHGGSGMCLFAKRLDQGTFTWPATQPQADGTCTASVVLTRAQLSMLLESPEWRAPVQTRRLMIADRRLKVVFDVQAAV